jgi:hypothetical protein
VTEIIGAQWARTFASGSLFAAALTACLILVGCDAAEGPADDAKAAGLVAADFPETSSRMFKDMDGGVKLDRAETKGRNSWILWTAGNQVFWDRMANRLCGVVDLIKTLDSRKRPRRFAEMGLINEPGFRQATRPDWFGLWLDEAGDPSPPDIDEEIYGRSSGIVGFRIYPNPDFDAAAKARWNPERFYRDPTYCDSNLVRPYRIGVTCAVCHVAPNPLRPPADPENPKWENLSSAIGNQYIREGKVFTLAKPGSFFWEMLNAQPPGTSDTSRPATDHINNPSAINAISLLKARLEEAAEERLAGGALAWPPGDEVRKVVHFLKDGADSVGAAGALMRVYLNEGLYAQQWLADHDVLLGLRPQKPFSVANAFRNSVYWQATYARTANIIKFFLRLPAMHLEDAPGGKAYISQDQAVMDRGGIVFADHCAGCHSSKQPPSDVAPGSEAARQWHREAVMRADFRKDNFLSTDRRYPVSKVETNACRALGTNATRGHIWDNFSSETYKELKPVGLIEVANPADEAKPYRFEAPAGGVGYYRPPSLASLWSSAPFLHNNSLGIFTGDPSVAGRMHAFDDAIEKLLWPEKRPGTIWRTTGTSSLKVASSFLPDALKSLTKGAPVVIGPIPKGTPINLLANIDPTRPDALKLIAQVELVLRTISARNREFSEILTDRRDGEILRGLVSVLIAASTCPDLVEDRGHLYGADLPDSDKRALIEFLKTL